ncbi:hypothetical protein [Halocella sp. SP3-1]|uniref:hypothetical protein n=1 Tax=Halocella sp. SP3-1 TaxID=2382161 RepID=UPI000F76130C|nr:hypothetical protein [Halocella sp. SP3-1]AZO95801.1 hypothetical protein D7D81_15065 [Halocella sp. SP3-1]
MKEIIQSKLDRMSDLQQRRILKNMMLDVFKGIIDYQEDVNQEIENRLFNEIRDRDDNFTIYNTIVKRERLDIVSDCLFPMEEEDYEEEQYDKKEILEKIRNNEPVKITKIYLKKSYPELIKMEREKHKFKGLIISEDKEIPIDIVLQHNEEYIAIEEEMYKIFMQNAVRWTTINNPYIRKFYDVVIAGCQEDMGELNEFEEIVFDLEELEEDKCVGYVPVWNIKKTTIKGEGFPLPTKDKVNYEHVIPYKNLGYKNGYLLAPNQNMISLRKNKDGIIITSNESNSIVWELFAVLQENNSLINDQYEFSLLSNKKKKSFVDSFFNKGDKVIRSYSELNRMLKSFEVTNDLQIKDINILDDLSALEKDISYDFNSYILDEIRADKFRKVLVIEFEAMELDYLKNDLISFITSEIQQYFPEYICKGVID